MIIDIEEERPLIRYLWWLLLLPVSIWLIVPFLNLMDEIAVNPPCSVLASLFISIGMVLFFIIIVALFLLRILLSMHYIEKNPTETRYREINITSSSMVDIENRIKRSIMYDLEKKKPKKKRKRSKKKKWI